MNSNDEWLINNSNSFTVNAMIWNSYNNEFKIN